METSKEQVAFIEETKKGGPVELTGQQLAEILIKFIGLGSTQEQKDRRKAVTRCENLIFKSGLTKSQIRALLKQRDYFKRMLATDPDIFESVYCEAIENLKERAING